MKRTILLMILLALPSAASAADPLLPPPRWSLEVKGGIIAPELADFEQYYGKSTMPAFAVSLAYKWLPQIALGIGAGMGSATGNARAVYHGTPAGRVTYELFPVNVFVVARGVVKEDQLLIPYVGAGWTRMYYRQTVQDQGKLSGSADGYHVRGGLQLSLNEMDRSASSSMYTTYGILRTSFFIEAERTRAVESSTSVDLGGMAYLAGLLFEF